MSPGAAMTASQPERVASVCPHDCPSTCALEVDRIDAHTVGRLRGAAANGYTAGVICAKVARYAERVHHPGRLTMPLRRVGAKGEGRAAFAPLSWADALDEVAERMTLAAKPTGAEAGWPHYFPGKLRRQGVGGRVV